MKKQFIPHGIPGATPCPPILTEGNGSKSAPKNFVPAGIEIKPTDDPLANWLLETFVNTEVTEIKKESPPEPL